MASALEEMKRKVAQLESLIREKDAELEESERNNIAMALQAKEKLAPYQDRIDSAEHALAALQLEEDSARKLLKEALADQALIKSSGEEEEGDLLSQIAEAQARCTVTHQRNAESARAYEEEALSLLGRIAFYSKKSAELQRKLALKDDDSSCSL